MNLTDIAIRVKRQFGDESAVQVMDDDIVRWVNDAQDYITSQNPDLLQESVTQNLVLGQIDYPFPADMLTLFSVSIKTLGTVSYDHVKFVSFQDFNDKLDGWDGTLYGNGDPFYYTTFDGVVKIFPPADAASVNGLKLMYNRAPATLAAPIVAQALDLPRQYHNAILNYCLQQAYEMDENFEAAQLKGGQVQSQVHTNRSNDTKNASEFYGTITTLYDDL